MKITESQAQEIRRRISEGESKRSLALEFGITHQSVTQIARLETHIPSGMERVEAMVAGREAALIRYIAGCLSVPAHVVVQRLLSRALLEAKDVSPEALVGPTVAS